MLNFLCLSFFSNNTVQQRRPKREKEPERECLEIQLLSLTANAIDVLLSKIK